MKKKWWLGSLCILLGVALIGGAYSYGKEHQKGKQSREQEIIGCCKASVITEQKPFVVIVPSYKNSLWCEKNIRSILEQKYENFRVIYIDDCSPDDTYDKVKAFVEKSGKANRVTLIHNAERKGSLANLYAAIWSCEDDEIIVDVDGDDFLAHDRVLDVLNEYFTNPDIWLTYGQCVEYPSYQKYYAKPYFKEKFRRRKSVRNYEFVGFHPRTFYARLFKKIKKEDLFYKGNFFPVTGDMAFFFPLIEMAWDHFAFIPEVLCLYNQTNPISDFRAHRKEQVEYDLYIRSLPAYAPLKELSF